MPNNRIPSLIWAKGKKTGFYYKIEEGTGDNLLKEDEQDGYVDYINYEFYKTLQDVYDENAYDGGMYLLKEYYQDMNVQKIVACVEELEEELEVLETYA